MKRPQGSKGYADELRYAITAILASVARA
jgi:hypothetical protein